MKKTIRLVSTLLILVMIATTMVTGCGKGKESSNSQSGNETLKIGVVKRGYGDEFAYDLAEAFEKKTGIKTEVAKSNSSGWTNTALLAGEKHNDIDVIFDINPTAMKMVATSNFLDGYERAFVDLSELYNSKLEGYDTDATLKELTLPYALDACTWGGEDAGYGDGKQYFVTWASGLEGLVYNKDLFDKYNLSVPKTTDEMFSLMDQMKALNKGTYPKNDDGYDIYPFAFSARINYLDYLHKVWWAQYDGLNVFYNAVQGKDANGVYTAESAKSAGKLSAFTIVADMLDVDKKYTEPDSAGLSFTDAQVLFLAEQSFMMCTGDWLEREMSAEFEESINIEFMRIPVNSNIIDKCSTITNDTQLSEVVSYIDGDITERPSYVSDEDLAYIESARAMYCSEGNGHICYIPAYSDNVEAGKQFIQFMLSAEGQNIMLNSYGNMSMLNVDVTKMENYSSLSSLQKSKFDILTKGDGAKLVGSNYVHPMNYAGGLMTTYNFMETAFFATKNSGNYMTAREFWMREYRQTVQRHSNAMSQAGVSN